MTNERRYSLLDQCCLSLDRALRALANNSETSGRPYPLALEQSGPLSAKEVKHVAGLMRVNHAGEICAQALYHGQAAVSRHPETREKLRQAALEEGDHLAWCHRRLVELSSHPSYLNPFWYMGSFGIGLIAGMAGDSWSLGFVAETEKQVVQHLQGHLQQLPAKDHQSHQILAQMQKDEEQHRQEAITMGAARLPWLVRKCMGAVSRVMVAVAYWV